jgi:predicted glutamine amidotransferase
MCLIIANFSQGKEVSREEFNNAKGNNADGIGISYSDGERIVIKKFITAGEQKKAYDYYRTVRALRPSPNVLIHFRYATHGVINAANCHPYRVNKNLCFVHNGIIDIKQPKTQFSDTWHFNEHIIKKLGDDFLFNDAIIALIEKFIGFSKLAFMDSVGNIDIINVDKGHYEGGNWFSNHSHTYGKSATTYKATTYKPTEYKPTVYTGTAAKEGKQKEIGFKRYDNAFNTDMDREIYGLSTKDKTGTPNTYSESGFWDESGKYQSWKNYKGTKSGLWGPATDEEI